MYIVDYKLHSLRSSCEMPSLAICFSHIAVEYSRVCRKCLGNTVRLLELYLDKHEIDSVMLQLIN
jgi:hypothetical protein